MTLNQQNQIIGERMSRYQKVRQEIGTVSYTISHVPDLYGSKSKDKESLLDLLKKHEASLKKPKKDTKPRTIQMSDKPRSSLEKVMEEIGEGPTDKDDTDKDPMLLGPLLDKATKDTKDRKDKDKDKDNKDDKGVNQSGGSRGKRITLTASLDPDKKKQGLDFVL
jgi:hypothetical protein